MCAFLSLTTYTYICMYIYKGTYVHCVLSTIRISGKIHSHSGDSKTTLQCSILDIGNQVDTFQIKVCTAYFFYMLHFCSFILII